MQNLDWGASGRVDEYWFELVDPFTLTVVDTIQGGLPENSSVTYGYYTDNLSEATIDLGGEDYIRQGRDMLIRVCHRIKIPTHYADKTYDEVGNERGSFTEVQEVLGTFFVIPDSKEIKFGLTRQQYNCYGPMYRLTQDYFADDYTRKKGQTIEGRIREAVEYAGGTLITAPGVDRTRNHTKDVWFQVGENRAESLRTVAGWAGWQFADTDYGEIVLQPYVEPRKREVKFTFEAGANCVYVGGFTEEREDSELCNRVVAWWSRDKIPTKPRRDENNKYVKDDKGETIYDPTDNFGLSDRYMVDLPSGHKLSYQIVGRRMTATLEVSDPCSHEDLVKKATEYLNSHSTDSYNIEIEHVGIPNLRAGDVVIYQNDRDVKGGIAYLCEISQMDISKLGPGCVTKSKLKILGETPLEYDLVDLDNAEAGA